MPAYKHPILSAKRYFAPGNVNLHTDCPLICTASTMPQQLLSDCSLQAARGEEFIAEFTASIFTISCQCECNTGTSAQGAYSGGWVCCLGGVQGLTLQGTYPRPHPKRSFESISTIIISPQHLGCAAGLQLKSHRPRQRQPSQSIRRTADDARHYSSIGTTQCATQDPRMHSNIVR